jgi:DNA-binding response OmpR family regulator
MRLLIAEDDPTLALGLEKDFRLEGYDVVVARDGPTASRLALSERFDLVILDVMLPGQDGFEVCREIRRSGVPVPILMLTARAQETDEVFGLDIGADDYITKPFSPRELRARVNAALRRSHGVPAAVYRLGGLEVDTGRCEATLGGEVVPLSALEFKLLAAFVRHRGRVLTRTMLLDEVWGTGTHVTDRVVDTHVMKLRRKIEPLTTRRYLVGVRGMGYRFDA